MTNTGPGWKNPSFPPGQLLILGALFFIPALSPSLFGWLSGLLAVPVFHLLTINGYKIGIALLRSSLLLAGFGALLTQGVETFFFSLTLVPVGYTLFTSALAGESAAKSGGKGVIALGLAWMVFWGVYGLLAGTNPYNYLLRVFDVGFQQTLELYSAPEAGITPEMLASLQQITNSLRETIPKLLPGLLASMVVLTVWINMAVANSLMARWGGAGKPPWGEYSTWRLPEQLVWAPIVGVTLLLISSGVLQRAGGWLTLVAGLLYFFQGLAVVIALLARWKVPVFVRIILYFVLLIQSYSLILLAILGLSDVWLNMRQTSKERYNNE